MSLEDSYPDWFERHWKIWPKLPIGRSKKAPSYKAAKKAQKELGLTDQDHAFILQDTETRVRTDSKWKLGFVPMMATYYNQRWWNESYAKIKAQQSSPEHAPSDHETNLIWVRDQIRLGRPVPASHEKYRAEAEQVH